jgi:hypothetical protein
MIATNPFPRWAKTPLRQKPQCRLIADAPLEHMRVFELAAAKWSRCKQ